MNRQETRKGKKVYVGMSGGVDSSVSAALLKKAGYDVVGVFIKVWQPDWITCTWREDRLDAMRVAAQLSIPFVTLDLEKEYKKEVVDYMIAEYKAGQTPNPDVACNRSVKFGGFYKWAMVQGADFVATGHYAQIKKLSARSYQLVAGLDQNKDQSYFLWTLTQEQLAHTLFPVGNIEKPKVRKLAQKFGLITADKKDSQGLCFIGKIDIKDFLKRSIPTKKGKVLSTEGKVIGYHDGATFLTIGERRGFTITQKTTCDAPYYVIAKDVKKNTLTVSHKESGGALLGTTVNMSVKNCNWISEIPKIGDTFFVRTRYRQTLEPVMLISATKSASIFRFANPQGTVTPGQSAVFYRHYECLGGGIIS